MESLKPLAELFQPDNRMADLVVHDRATGVKEPYSIQHHYDRYAGLTIDAQIPDEIASSWATAQYLPIYGYYAYPFIPLAISQALTTLEFALRRRTRRENARGLCELLEAADKMGLIDRVELLPSSRLPAGALLPGEGPPYDANAYWKVLLRILPGMRNIFAHGTHALYPDALVSMDIPRRIIRQIYSRAEALRDRSTPRDSLA